MSVLAVFYDTTEYQPDVGPSYQAGMVYELQSCPQCGKPVLVSGHWHDQMEGDDWTPAVVLPEVRDRDARLLLASHDLDLQCMVLAVDEARKSKAEDRFIRPKVGAVASRRNTIVGSAHRGEIRPGEHAEYTLLEGKCATTVLAGATVYTTLEPCTTRNHPKQPCVDRLIARKVSRVVIGMLDPDERIRGRGVLALRKANIRVDLFPLDLMTELEELNRDFISEKEQRSDREVRPTAGRSEPNDEPSKRELVLLAKRLLNVVISLPTGMTEESLQNADRLFRAAVLPTDDELSELRRDASRVGASAGELALAATENLGFLLKVCREVQATSRSMGFRYDRMNWKEWTFHWIEAERGLKALTSI
ncbi:MAG TPA: deaminase [Candidatus Acidoferrum sp.]|jgi:pyrimidine deaminase RibD-like protein|nr:deaminase [Candidatus Acidoferrum sp.]